MQSEIRSGGLSPVELIDAHLRQIGTHNPRINAFTTILDVQGREAARQAADDLARGIRSGPLHGIPLTVKDSFDVEGLPTWCGSLSRKNHRASCDATAVARLRRAGAIILAKTNCPEFLMNYETDNHLVGRTNNPWNLDRTPGGSSGGESAAIAAFCSPGGIGSDGGGSIRFPAHCTGIVGLKPTPGRCPATGHFPDIVHPGGLLGVGGPMARTAGDVRILFDVLAGHDPQDPFSAPVAVRPPDLAGIRIGVMSHFPGVPAEAALPNAVHKAAGLLSEAGFAVEEFTPKSIQAAPPLWRFFFIELAACVVRDLITSQTHWTGRELFDTVLDKPEPTAKTVLEKFALRDRMRGALLREMERYRVLLWPAASVVAFPHRQREWKTPERPIDYFEAMAPLVPVNLFGLPAMVVPILVTAENLPIGIQLIGRPWEEELLLELAIRLEQARGRFPTLRFGIAQRHPL